MIYPLPLLVPCAHSSQGQTDAKHQVLQFPKSIQPLHWKGWLHPLRSYSFLDHKKTEQSSFCTPIQTSVCLKCSKVSRSKKTGPYSPCSHFTTNSTGELPNTSNHRRWERFHTTLDILRHGQTHAQPQSQYTHTHTHASQSTICAHSQTRRHNLYFPGGQTFWTAICPKT